MRKAIRLRYDLTPYIYTAARQAYDTGLSITRPLYYYWPEDDNAYEWKEEFMFGDDILATTVCQPVDKITGLAERTMWFPEGSDWYDMSTGIMYKGGTVHNLLYTIDENPYFVKAGAVIPMAGQKIMTLQEQSPELRLVVVPGLGKATTKVYEDDGMTRSYDSEYTITDITKITTEHQVTVKIAPRNGTFKGMLPNRRISVVLDGFYAPSKVTVNGTDIPYKRFASYEQETGANKELEVVISFDGMDTAVVPSGSKGLITRFTAIAPETKLNFFALKIRDFQLPSEFTAVAQCGSFITEKPHEAPRFIQAMDTKAMIENINSWKQLDPEFKTKIAAQTIFEK